MVNNFLYPCHLYRSLLDIDPEDAEMDIETDNGPSSVKTALLPSLVPPLMALIQPTSLSFPPLAAPSPNPPITSALSAVHVGAFECLTNVFLGISTFGNAAVSQDKAAGKKVWDDIWSTLGLVGTESGPGQERRQEIWENAVGVLWGVSNVWKGALVSYRGTTLMFILNLLS